MVIIRTQTHTKRQTRIYCQHTTTTMSHNQPFKHHTQLQSISESALDKMSTS